jgi:hypothetical protein
MKTILAFYLRREARLEAARMPDISGMASLLYQNYLVVASGQRDERNGQWGVWVGVYWSFEGKRLSKIFNFLTERFTTKGDAEKFGLQTGASSGSVASGLR